MSSSSGAATMLWGCDDPNEGTIHGQWDATHGLDVKEEDHKVLIDSLEAARARGRATAREARAGEAAAAESDVASAPMATLFEELQCFALRRAGEGGDELKLYDAMQNPDKLMAKH
eukprot:436792-Prymnesium_polylepis.1